MTVTTDLPALIGVDRRMFLKIEGFEMLWQGGNETENDPGWE
jgi:hypothetical protein